MPGRAESLLFPMVLHDSCSMRGSFFSDRLVFKLTDGRNHYLSKDFQGFAEFVWLITVAPADGQSVGARFVKSLLFPMVLHASCSIRGWFFLTGWLLN